VAIAWAIEASLRERRAQEVVAKALQTRPIVSAYGAVGIEVEPFEAHVAWTAQSQRRDRVRREPLRELPEAPRNTARL